MRTVEIREGKRVVAQWAARDFETHTLEGAINQMFRDLLKTRAGTVSSGKSDVLRTEAERLEASTSNIPKLDENRVYVLGQASGLRQAANMIDA